jgi:hypothetical protein
MKTQNFFSVLSLALIFATANTVYPAIPEKPANREDKANVIVFKVNVHHTSDLAICGTYQVRLLNADGSLLAPPQTFIPGVTTYVFTKVLWPDRIRPMYIWKTKITAVLINVSANEDVCPVELITREDSKLVFFTPGQTILFDLFPNVLHQTDAATAKVKE